MDIHPYKRACWTYAHTILGDDLAPFQELVQRLGASMVVERDAVEFGKLLVACHAAGYKRAFEEYKKHLANLGFQIEGQKAVMQPRPESPASAPKAGSPAAARPAKAGSGRHATTASLKGRRG